MITRERPRKNNTALGNLCW